MKLKKVLFVLVFMFALVSTNLYSEESESVNGKTWGLTTQVSYNSIWAGCVVHFGNHFFIRPGIISIGYPNDNYSTYGLRSDFLFAFPIRDKLSWYIGPTASALMTVYFDGGDLELLAEVGVLAGAQVMISDNFAFYTDVGIIASGGTDFFNGFSNPLTITLRSLGLGAVIYLK